MSDKTPTRETCKYCKRKVYARCDFLHANGDWTRIRVCERHFQLGLAEQGNVSFRESLSGRMGHFGERSHITGSQATS